MRDYVDAVNAIDHDPSTNDLKVILLQTVRNFLCHHGMSRRYVKQIVYKENGGDVIIGNLDMANSDYTRALGLLLLLFTEHNPYLYLSFRRDIITIEYKGGDKPYDDLKKGIEYIKERTNVKINY